MPERVWRVPAVQGIMAGGVVRRRFIMAGMAVTTIVAAIGGAVVAASGRVSSAESLVAW